MRVIGLILLMLVVNRHASAEVLGVTITSRTVVAHGHAFGAAGAYEKLVGRIEFALDPSDPQNRRIVDLEFAPRAADGRVGFSSDLFVLRPVDASKANGVLLFEIANRGNKSVLRSLGRGAQTNDPMALPDFGDGFLLNEGFTIVWVGWEFDVAAPRLRVDAPPAVLPAAAAGSISIDILVDERTTEARLTDDGVRPPVVYPPAEPNSASAELTVRDLYWDRPIVIPRKRWRFVPDPSGIPRLQMQDGFEPGRWYRVAYRPTGAVVAGVGLAAVRDAASAFRYRTDLPIRGRAAYAYGRSQTGRFLRQFLYDGFNADERRRRVFDALWIHIAGAARGSFNERFATPSLGDPFEPTQFPFTDDEQADVDGRRDGLQSRYTRELRPKVFYTNTPVEYWGYGRAAALTHVSLDGTRDLPLSDTVRMYMLAGTQHVTGTFPPSRAGSGLGPRARNDGQQLSNPTPQDNVMRALFRALHHWASDGTPPPESRYPRLSDGTLVRVDALKFPIIPGVADPRRIVGPGRVIAGNTAPLPFLVPQVDADGNEIAGVHDPEAAVPLATTTGWNFRDERVGNPRDLFPTLGSYVPFAATKAGRAASGDPRLSIEERYRGLEDYVERVRAAALQLIRGRYMLDADLPGVLARARAHWEFATARAVKQKD
jgi:hypothetical protein